MFLLGYGLLWIPWIAFAGLVQHAKLWLSFDKTETLANNPRWFYSLTTQMRGSTSAAALETFFFDGRLGYLFFTNFNVEFGYRWSGNDPGNHFYSEHRPYQQIQLPLMQHDCLQFMARSRLEERIRNNEDQIALRFRQRIAMKIKYRFFWSIYPYFYDEVFFRLNKTDFTPNHFLNEHRFFIGFKRSELRQSHFQFGYINQYTFKSSHSVKMR